MYNELVQRLREHNGWALNETLDQAADAIENTSKAYEMMAEAYEAEVTKSYWIPVTERLPEQGKRYLVIRYDYVTNTSFIDILWYDVHDLWWNRMYKGDYNVTHWMPLPDKPKGER